LVRSNGDKELQVSREAVNRIVRPGQQIAMKVSFKNPSKAGNYLAVLRLTHGNNIEFGDKAILDLKVEKAPEPEIIIPEVKKDDKSKAIERSEMMLDKFENNDKLEKSFELDGDAQSVESNEIQIIDDSPVIKDEAPSENIQREDEPKDSKTLIEQKPERSVFVIDEDADKALQSIIEPAQALKESALIKNE